MKSKIVVTIDAGAGFCSGVKRAISSVESLLKSQHQVFCLGEIVHNEAELNRLKQLGMLEADQVECLPQQDNSRFFIRAHGEPPGTFSHLEQLGLSYTDGTCPVVVRLQQRVRKASQTMAGNGGIVVLFGKRYHPEIIGLAGNAAGNVIIAEDLSDMVSADYKRPMVVFAQTTANADQYAAFCHYLTQQSKQTNDNISLIEVNNSICAQVSRRVPNIKKFASMVDVVIFVCGTDSSNGKALAAVSKEVNQRTYVISDADQLRAEWILNAAQIGVSGATSTPQWQLEEVAAAIKKIV